MWATIICLEPTLMIIMRINASHINLQPTLDFSRGGGHVLVFSGNMKEHKMFLGVLYWRR